MKKFLNIFFVTLGVIFFILILIGVYLYVADPLNIKSLLSGTSEVVERTAGEQSDDGTTTDSASEVSAEAEARIEDRNPLLNENQEAVLEAVGIDPASIPSEISADEEQCLIEAVGKARAEEIKAGATPSATEIFKARGCL